MWGRQSNRVRQPESAIAMAAKGFGESAENADDVRQTLLEDSPELLKDFEATKVEEEGRPKFILQGPLRPPSAPATYKTISKVRLRTAPDMFADLKSTEIEKGATFRVLQAKEVDGLRWLRTDPTYEEGWLLERGVAGKLRGKKSCKADRRLIGCWQEGGPCSFCSGQRKCGRHQQ